MAVILSREETYAAGKDDKCAICGEAHLSPPYVYWYTEDGLYLCGQCCSNLRDGLVADFIQVIAIRDLKNLGYNGMTFTRESQVTVDKEAKKDNPRNYD
jgi:hypothetical protein